MYRYFQMVKDHRATFDDIKNLGIRISSDVRLEPGVVDRVWAAISADDLIRTMDSYIPKGENTRLGLLYNIFDSFQVPTSLLFLLAFFTTHPNFMVKSSINLSFIFLFYRSIDTLDNGDSDISP